MLASIERVEQSTKLFFGRSAVTLQGCGRHAPLSRTRIGPKAVAKFKRSS
jgi:hypothetical protein